MPVSTLNDVIAAVNADNFDAIDRGTYHVFRHTFFHRIDYAAATKLDLFTANGNNGSFITNLPQAGLFPSNVLFRLQTARVIPERGVTLAGAANNNTPSFSASAAVTNVFPFAQTLEQIMTAGAFSLRVGKRDIILPTPGLWKFPQGGGPDGYTSVATTVAATSIGAAVANNGAAVMGNAYPMVPYTCLGGEDLQAALTWATAVTPSNAFTMRVELEGVAVVVASR